MIRQSIPVTDLKHLINCHALGNVITYTAHSLKNQHDITDIVLQNEQSSLLFHAIELPVTQFAISTEQLVGAVVASCNYEKICVCYLCNLNKITNSWYHYNILINVNTCVIQDSCVYCKFQCIWYACIDNTNKVDKRWYNLLTYYIILHTIANS